MPTREEFDRRRRESRKSRPPERTAAEKEFDRRSKEYEDKWDAEADLIYQEDADAKNKAARDAAHKRMGGGGRPQDKGQASQRGRDYRSDALIPIKRHINRALDATEIFGEEDKLDTERKGPEIKKLSAKKTDKAKHQKKVDAAKAKRKKARSAEAMEEEEAERWQREAERSRERGDPRDRGEEGPKDPGSKRYSGPGVEDTSDHAREMPGVRPEDTAKDPWWADYQASTKAEKAGKREKKRLTK